MSNKFYITAFYWISTFCDGAFRIIVPLYFTSLGIKTSNIGIMFFFYELFGFLTNIFSGFLINRIGYKKSFMLALFLHSLSSFLYIALYPEMDVMLMMVVISIARSLRGCGKELVKTASSAYLKKEGHSGKNYLFAQVLLGGKDGLKGLGVLIGGVLMGVMSFHYNLIFLGSLTLLSMIGSYFVLSEFKETKSVPLPEFFSVKKKMRRLAVMRALLYAGRDTWIVVALPIYLLELQQSKLSISVLLAVGLILFGGFQPLFARLIHRGVSVFGKVMFEKIRYRDTLFITSFMLVLAPFVVLIDVTDMQWIWGGVILYNVLAGLATVPHNHLHIKYARSARSSVDIAYYKTIAQIGKLAAVLLSGFIYEIYGLAGCIYMSSACLLVCSLMGLQFIKKKPA